jgi:hypothetical protein
LNTPVINFLQKFKQKSLLGNVNLDLPLQKFTEWNTNTLKESLSHLLPAIDNINSLRGQKYQLIGLCNANSEAKAMLKMTRFLEIS